MDNVLIVGGGMAGAATAYFLSGRGLPVTILERESMPGIHSTGRNAAILRTLIGDPAIQTLARESLGFYLEPPAGFAPEPLVNRVGLFLAAPPEYSGVLTSWAGEALEDPGTELVNSDSLYQRVPVLGEGLTEAVFRREEGTLDVNAILHGFLGGARRQGAEVRYGCTALRLAVRSNRLYGVETNQGVIDGRRVVIAAGGWAGTIPSQPDISLPITPYRRHLLVTAPLTEVAPDWPVVWIAGHEFYFRPESGGLLMCGCDTSPVSPEQGETVDPAVLELIAEKCARWLPSFAGAGAARIWAGMRTFVPDQRFVIGPDPRVHGLFWVAALGGHGITCAPAVGRLAAQWVAEGHSSHPAASALHPGRLLGPGSP